MSERIRAAFERRKREWSAAERAKPAARETNPPDAGDRGAGVVGWVRRAWDAANSKAILTQLLLGIVAITLVIAFFDELASTSPVIQPVSLPEMLVKQGYSQDGMSAAIRAEVQKIKTDLDERADRTARRGYSLRSSSMQIDVPVPGATFSLRTVVRVLRDLLRLPDRSVSIDVRCRHDEPRVEPTTGTRTAGARQPITPRTRPPADCNADRLWVKVIAQDAMGRKTMTVHETGPIGADKIAAQIARLIAKEYMPGMYAGSLLAEAQDAVIDGNATVDFDAVRLAYDQAERFADRPRTRGERFIEQDWTERGVGRNWEEQKLLAQLGRVDAWLAEAEMLRARQPDQDATSLLEHACALAAGVIASRRDYGLAHAAMGSVLFRLGRPEEAMAAYETGDLVEPRNFILHSNWANGLHELDASDAARVLGQQSAPRHETVFERRRRVAAAQTDAEIDHHRKALDFAPQDDPARSVLYSNLGYGLAKAGRCDEALTAFESAQRRNPGHGYELLGMGECLLARGDPYYALKVLQRALKRAPKDEAVMIAMARALIEKGKAAEALGVIEQLPDSATHHYLAAQGYEQLEQYAQAGQRYGKALKGVQDGQAIAWLQDPLEVFEEYARLVDARAATVMVQRGIRASPKSVGVRDGYARALIRLERWQDAEIVLADAVKLDRGEAKEYADETDDDFAIAYADLALVRAMRNRVELALEAADTALALDDTAKRAQCVKTVLTKAASEPAAGSGTRSRNTKRLDKC